MANAFPVIIVDENGFPVEVTNGGISNEYKEQLDQVIANTLSRSEVKDLIIPLPFVRTDSSGVVISNGNMSQTENNSVNTIIGYNDVGNTTNITDISTGVNSKGVSKIILEFKPTEFRTTNPSFGVGFVSGTNRVVFIWRNNGQLAFIRAQTSTFTELLAADISRDYNVNDVVRMELLPTNNSTQVNLYIADILVASYTSPYIPTGEILIGMRGSVSLEYTLKIEQAGAIQAELDYLTKKNINLLIPEFTEGSYYSSGSGSVFTGAGWKRTTNLIPVLPNTTYTISGINTEFIGNEYNSSVASGATRIRVIVTGVGGAGSPFTQYTFTTSPTTTHIGLNLTSSGKSDTSAVSILNLGSTVEKYLPYGATALDADMIRGASFTNNVIASNIYYSYEPTGFNDVQSGSTQGTGIFYIYVKYSPSSLFYARYKVAHLVNGSIRADVWKITGCDLYKYNSGVMESQNINLLINTENEFVFRQGAVFGTKVDFTGGYHGDEILSEVFFYVDGVRISTTDLSSSIALKSATDFWYTQKSLMYETPDASTPATIPTTVLCTHQKITKFGLNGSFTTFNRVTWNVSIPIFICYFGLITVGVSQSGTVYTEQLNPITTTGSNNEYLDEVGSREMYFYNNSTKLGAFVTSKITKALNGSTDNTNLYDFNTRLVAWDRTTDTKYYRRLQNKTTAINEIWEGECTYRPYKQ